MKKSITVTVKNAPIEMQYNTKDPFIKAVIKSNKQTSFAEKCKLVKMLRNRLEAAWCDATQFFVFTDDYTDEDISTDMIQLAFAEKSTLN